MTKAAPTHCGAMPISTFATRPQRPELLRQFDIFGNPANLEKAPYAETVGRDAWRSPAQGPDVLLPVARTDRHHRQPRRDHRPDRGVGADQRRVSCGTWQRAAEHLEQRVPGKGRSPGRRSTTSSHASTAPTSNEKGRRLRLGSQARLGRTAPTGACRSPRPTSCRRSGSTSSECSMRMKTRRSRRWTHRVAARVSESIKAGQRSKSWASRASVAAHHAPAPALRASPVRRVHELPHGCSPREGGRR